MTEKVLSAAEIGAAQDVVIRRVRVPEWGGVVCVRGMTGDERDAFEAEQSRLQGPEGRDMQSLRARLLVRCLCDEQGRPLYAPEAYRALGARAAKVLDRLYEVASRLSGFGKREEAELLGESAGDPSSAAGTASPS